MSKSIHISRKILLIPFLALFISCGTGRNLPSAEESAITREMTKKEVKTILGRPKYTNTSGMTKISYGLFTIWTYPEKDTYVYFRNDRVIGTKRISK